MSSIQVMRLALRLAIGAAVMLSAVSPSAATTKPLGIGNGAVRLPSQDRDVASNDECRRDKSRPITVGMVRFRDGSKEQIHLYGKGDCFRDTLYADPRQIVVFGVQF